MTHVLLLAGSPTDEFFDELSRTYAADCLDSIADPARYAISIAHVSPGGGWRFPADLDRATLAGTPALSTAEAVGRLGSLGIDVMVPQLFCRAGMTTYRALFDLLGIPYVGNPAELMALTADKAATRAVVAAAGVDVPAGEVLRAGERPSRPTPAVVKPVAADNSSGVTLVRDVTDYDTALRTAFAHGPTVLVEDFVPLGREVRCGVLDRGGALECLPLEEYALDAEQAPVRTEQDKVARTDDGAVRLVAKDSPSTWLVDPADPVTDRVWDVARQCHRALGCRDYSLFDFRVDPSGRPWFLEAGLYNSFARKSVISTMAAGAGLGVPEVFASLVAQAMARA